MPSGVYVKAFLDNLGLPWVHLEASSGILGAFGAILAETVFVYERSEGLTNSNDHLEVPGREESCLVPGCGPPWGYLGRGPKGVPEGTKKRSHFGVGFGAILGPKKDPKMGPKLVQKLLNLGSIFGSLFFKGFGALWVPLGSLLGPLEALLGGLWTPKTLKN